MSFYAPKFSAPPLIRLHLPPRQPDAGADWFNYFNVGLGREADRRRAGLGWGTATSMEAATHFQTLRAAIGS